MSDALTIMSENLEDVLPICQLAIKIGSSPRQLKRCCKECLGVPSMKMYRDLRLSRAHQLLAQTDLSISEISVASGFN